MLAVFVTFSCRMLAVFVTLSCVCMIWVGPNDIGWARMHGLDPEACMLSWAHYLYGMRYLGKLIKLCAYGLWFDIFLGTSSSRGKGPT